MPLKLMYITNDLDIALIAQKCGVDRVWIDLETIGKEDRQKGLDAVKSHHTVDDIKKIKPYLTTAEMLVGVNHWYEGSEKEIEDAGADMVRHPAAHPYSDEPGACHERGNERLSYCRARYVRATYVPIYPCISRQHVSLMCKGHINTY